MAFATVSANLGARFLVRGVFYVHRRWRAVQSAGEESGAPTAETSNSTTSSNEDISSPLILYKDIERPMDTLPMVHWFSILLVASVFDILVQLKVFLGRYDARTMQPPLQQPSKRKNHKTKKSYDHDSSSEEECFDHLPPGCAFDFRNSKTSQENELASCSDWIPEISHAVKSGIDLISKKPLLKESKSVKDDNLELGNCPIHEGGIPQIDRQHYHPISHNNGPIEIVSKGDTTQKNPFETNKLNSWESMGNRVMRKSTNEFETHSQD